MVFRAPYCTDPSPIYIPGMPPAESPEEHVQRSGGYISYFFPDVCLAGPGCISGKLTLDHLLCFAVVCRFVVVSCCADLLLSPICARAAKPGTNYAAGLTPAQIRGLQEAEGWRHAEHWGPYGPELLGFRELPSQIKQMQPTGVDTQGDEGRLQALEAATVARAEGDDWGSIAQYLRESPAAGPLRPEERRMVKESQKVQSVMQKLTSMCPVSMEYTSKVENQFASMVYLAENRSRIRRRYPQLEVSGGRLMGDA
jgi:hypothetical protein